MINIIYMILVVLNLISLIVSMVREFRFLETEQYGLANSQGIKHSSYIWTTYLNEYIIGGV